MYHLSALECLENNVFLCEQHNHIDENVSTDSAPLFVQLGVIIAANLWDLGRVVLKISISPE